MMSTNPLYSYERCAHCLEVFGVEDDIIGNDTRAMLLHITCARLVAWAVKEHDEATRRRRAEANAALPDDDPRKRRTIKQDGHGNRIA